MIKPSPIYTTIALLSRWSRLAFAILVFVAAGGHSTTAAGVTVITHGWQYQLSPYPEWMDTMARAITNVAVQKGQTCSWYHLRIGGDIVSGYNSVLSIISTETAAQTSEVVLTVDWSNIADHTQLGGGNLYNTEDVAGWISGGLRVTDTSIGLASPLASRPLHLIGHSRGGSVMLETARLLGTHGIWVDHLTTLDPHPLTFPDIGVFPLGTYEGDPAAVLYDNVVFADNYWRKDTGNPNPVDFNGQKIAGTEGLELDESILEDLGYGLSKGSEHSDLHAWYHGTIGTGNDFPSFDGDVSITDAWYALPHPARNLSGFFYSRIANGQLLYRPAFSYAVGSLLVDAMFEQRPAGLAPANGRTSGSSSLSGCLETVCRAGNRLPPLTNTKIVVDLRRSNGFSTRTTIR